MNTVTAKLELLENCKDREYREALNIENVYATVCAQIRALREQRGLSQRDLGRIVDMAQERISILEDPNAETKPTLNTLLRFAAGYDVGLDIRFVPFATVLDRSTRTDEVLLKVDRFDDELPELERSLRSEQASAAAGSLIDIGQFKASKKDEPVPVTAHASASVTSGNSNQGGAMLEIPKIPPSSVGANMATGMPLWKS